MKKFRYHTIIVFMIMYFQLAFSQTNEKGIIQGRIFNATNNEALPFSNIVIWGTNIGSTSDLDGNFIFTGIKPGFVELRVSSVGFKDYISAPIQVTNAKKVFLEIGLEEANLEIAEVVVKVSPFKKSEESPVSLRSIGIAEIEKSPGGNRDISKVLQSLPGVASTPSFRNDVIVRGGGSSENKFFLDGVEIPNINHFATQGASGGPVGILNVDFIREVNFYSGAFPANYGNALSSVLDFRQIDGNQDKLRFKGSVGASDLALTLDGPLSEKTTYILSARRSYLQFLFGVIGLPFLPTYNDFQFKVRTRIDSKNELTFIGLGALDQFKLNMDANETPEQRYILNYLPVNEQWNYSFGAVYKHFRGSSYDTWVLSRSFLNNSSYKYLNNVEVDSLKILDYRSTERENKLRYEYNTRTAEGYKIMFGAGLEYALYTNETKRASFTGTPLQYGTVMDLFKWSVFGQISKNYFDDKLSLSVGLRSDANNYSSEMNNLLDQISPRFSASYMFIEDYFINFNVGRYYQLPPYTSLGYKNNAGEKINKQNNIKYSEVNHIVNGMEHRPNENSRITLEGFFKYYRKYPFSITDSVSLASKGADFGTYGDEEITSTGIGRAYGAEILYQHKNLLGANLNISYTLVRSEFQDNKGVYVPSSWDNKHLLNILFRKSFKGNWDVGFKWRLVGGSPYTPTDTTRSALVDVWNVQGRSVLDYSRFNRERLKTFHQLDFRIDKEYYFSKWSLNVYLDVQNIYNFKSDSPPTFIIDENVAPFGTPQQYQLTQLASDGGGTVLPTIGIIIQF